MRQATDNHRGVALVLALAVLVVVLTTITVVANRAAMMQFEGELDQCTLLASELARSAESAILHWLETQSQLVVLPPDALTPEFPVLQHIWQLGGRTVEVRVTAWDQCGMVPLESAMAGSPLRLTLPELVIRELESRKNAESPRPGLDRFLSANDEPSSRVFPLPAVSEAIQFSIDGQDRAVAPLAQLPTLDDDVNPPSLGALVATHQAFLPDERPGSPQINVNTAPAELIRSALREAGRGGIESILAARERGEQFAMAALPRPARARADDHSHRPRLTTTSHSWAFRIDVRVDRARTSWWRIYQLNPDENRSSARRERTRTSTSANQSLGVNRGSRHRPRSGADSGRSQWECVQSIVIPY